MGFGRSSLLPAWRDDANLAKLLLSLHRPEFWAMFVLGGKRIRSKRKRQPSLDAQANTGLTTHDLQRRHEPTRKKCIQEDQQPGSTRLRRLCSATWAAACVQGVGRAAQGVGKVTQGVGGAAHAAAPKRRRSRPSSAEPSMGARWSEPPKGRRSRAVRRSRPKSARRRKGRRRKRQRQSATKMSGRCCTRIVVLRTARVARRHATCTIVLILKATVHTDFDQAVSKPMLPALKRHTSFDAHPQPNPSKTGSNCSTLLRC